MPSKKKDTSSWRPEHTAALQQGFKDKNWDPYLTDGKQINATIKSDPAIFEILKPFFSTAKGGLKTNNNQIYTHYKNQAIEYITHLAKIGFAGVGRPSPSPICLSLLGPLTISPFCHIAESHLEDQGVAGGCKRSANETEEEADEEEEAADEYFFGDFDMSSSKKPAASTPTAGGPSRGTPRHQTAEDDMEFVANRMNKMSLSSKTSGFNFNCVYPHFWWSYSVMGIRYLKYEFLVWTCYEDEVNPKISKCGNFLYQSYLQLLWESTPRHPKELFRENVQRWCHLDTEHPGAA